MSFKIEKSKFNVFNKPRPGKSKAIKLPIPIAATALSLTAEKIKCLV